MIEFLFFCFIGGVALLVAPHITRATPWARYFVVGFSLIASIRYMVWRFAATLPEFEWSAIALFCYVFVVVEALLVYNNFRQMTPFVRRTNRTPEANRQLDWYGTHAPKIHVLIPTYNEPWSVLERTLVGVTEQNYPNYQVWLLDDGRREWLREKAREWNVGYVTRSDNRHFKAGNINHGLAFLRAQGHALEFVSVLDADFVARPEFLRRAMALMQDERVAIAQTPQWFYNPDLYQRKLGGVHAWPDEQRQWFDEVEPSWDAEGRALCCGTSFVMRLRALDDIGGVFPIESISEDSLCSLRLKGFGWKTVYLNEPLTVGLAPEGLKEYLTQRARWQHGWVEIGRFFGPGKTLISHFHYWLGQWRPVIFAIVKIVWFSAPLLYWFCGTWMIQVQPEEALSYMAPAWIERFFLGWMFSGRRLYLTADAHYNVQLFMNVRVVIDTVVLKRPKPFTVTDKAVTTGGVTVHWTTLRWFLLLGVPHVVGILYTLLDPAAPMHGHKYLALNLALSLYSLLHIVAAALPTIELPRHRVDDRYETNESVMLSMDGRPLELRCRNISVGGVLLEHERDAALTDNAILHVAGVGAVRARAVRRPNSTLTAYAFESPEHRRALVRKIYCTPAYVPLPERWSLSGAIGSFFKAVFA